MNVTVIGGSGRIGSKVVDHLGDLPDVRVHIADLNTEVNAFTGEGLQSAVDGADVVVDVSDSPSLAELAATDFFRTATGNVIDAAMRAGVQHHVVLSIVGVEMLDAGYFAAKRLQEQLVVESSVPYSILHATQFFEFLLKIADAADVGGTVRLPPVLMQPVAADEVAAAIARTAVGAPANAVIEFAGPDRLRLDQVVQRALDAAGDGRMVLADSRARYFGAKLDELTLVPSDGASLGAIDLDGWLAKHDRRR